MTKRADQKFVRVAQDKYYTPPAAIEPLLAHLAPGTRFIEPCAGDGRLAAYLNSKGHRCVWACDIAPEAKGITRLNALDIAPASYRVHADCFITNPPWDRPILHALIRHLPTMLPTWLLFDADWMHTEFGRTYGERCTRIVSIGRVKWIEGSANTGFDNACWYLFDQPRKAGPRFFWRQENEREQK
jgi:predicted RNA methylase